MEIMQMAKKKSYPRRTAKEIVKLCDLQARKEQEQHPERKVAQEMEILVYKCPKSEHVVYMEHRIWTQVEKDWMAHSKRFLKHMIEK